MLTHYLLIVAVCGLLTGLSLPLQAQEPPAEPAPDRSFVVTVADNADPESAEKVWRLVQSAYQAIGIRATRLQAPLARLYVMVESQQADAALAGFPETVELQYPSLIRVETPIFTTAYHLYARTPFNYQEPGTLQAMRVVSMRGSETVKRALPGTEIIWVNEAIQMVRMLELGRADVAIGLEKHMMHLLAQTPESGIRRLDEVPFFEITLYHYISPRHRELAPRLSKSLAAIKARLAQQKQQGENTAP